MSCLDGSAIVRYLLSVCVISLNEAQPVRGWNWIATPWLLDRTSISLESCQHVACLPRLLVRHKRVSGLSPRGDPLFLAPGTHSPLCLDPSPDNASKPCTVKRRFLRAGLDTTFAVDPGDCPSPHGFTPSTDRLIPQGRASCCR